MAIALAVFALSLLQPSTQGQDAAARVAPAGPRLDFTEAVNLPTGVSPYFAVAVDLNGDGHLDLAASNTVSHSVTVYLNKKNGTFGRGAEYPTKGYTPYALAAGDLDGDGDADLVCGNMFSMNYSVFYNKGDGTFEDTVLQKGEAGPMFPVIADLDGDDKPDLAICNIGHDDVSVHLNKGGRRFEHAGTYPVKGVVPYSVAAADFDGDGDKDLATGNIYSSNVSLLENLGGGRFGEARTFKTESLTQIVFPADFNRDGRLDLVTGNGGSDNISVLINDGSGGFLSPVNYPVKLPQGVTAGDIDGDGDLDVATANQSANTTSILLNRGDGTFQPAIDFQVQGLYPTGVLMADLDRNGRLDLVTANSGSGNLSILYNAVRVPKPIDTTPSPAASVVAVDGKLPQPVRVRFNTPMSIEDTSVAQLRGSQSGTHAARLSSTGDPQVIQIDPVSTASSPAGKRFFAGEQVTIAFRAAILSKEGLSMKRGFESAFGIQPTRGTGHFEPRDTVASGPVAGGTAADLDGDGRLDVVAIQEGSRAIRAYFNSAAKLFGEARDFPSDLLDPRALTVTDVDRDGLLDLVVIDGLLPAAAVMFNQSNRVFSAPVKVELSPDARLSQPVALAAADFNGDGLVDLATANRLTDDITVALNASGRRFRTPVRIPVGSKPTTIASGDLDGNGVPDLLTVNTRADTVSLFINDGTASFLKKDELPLLYGDPKQVVAGDLNRDGAVDLLVVDATSTELVRFQNNGDGTFRRPDYLTVPAPPIRAAVTDVNADGLADLVVAHAEGVVVLRAGRDGKYESGPLADLRADASPIPGDFDGDGTIDLVIPAGGKGLTLLANITRATSASTARPDDR